MIGPIFMGHSGYYTENKGINGKVGEEAVQSSK